MEDFVTSQMTKKLKEKGYPLLKVVKQDGNPFIYDLPEEHPNWQNCDAWYIPTICQVLKWLREKHKLHICIDLDTNKNWFYSIEGINNDFSYIDISDYCSYEDAITSGICYALDTLIK